MLTSDKITSIFCFIDDMLKETGHKEYKNRKVSDSEVLTTGLISALYFKGHLEHSMSFMKITGAIPNMLEKSRFSRRLHKLMDLLLSLFIQLGKYIKDIIGASNYIIDSFPVPVCHNIRISRSKLLKGEQYRGYKASMRQYFYGIKVQVITTESGLPVEFCFVPGSEHDVKALAKLSLELPPESSIYGDSAYTDYLSEADLLEADGVKLMIQRKSNSKKPDNPWITYIKQHFRKKIETTFSEIKGLFPNKIHATSTNGFLLKIMLFIVAFTFNKIAT